MKTAQQTQHTPGPWSAVLDPCPTTRNRWLVEKRRNGWKTFVAEVYADPEHTGGPDWQGSKEANARLIAAAPELLEALKIGIDCHDSNAAITGKYKGSQQLCQCRFCIAARAAIAKAEGH